MAGRGPAPKKPQDRARTNKPARGEWKTLTETLAGKRPALPRVRGGLLASTKATWEGWWSSPMAAEWQPTDYPMLAQMIVMEDKVTRALLSGEFFHGFASMQRELRTMKDSLGLTEKGRRELRWEIPGEDDGPQLASVSDISSRQRPDPRRRKKK